MGRTVGREAAVVIGQITRFLRLAVLRFPLCDLQGETRTILDVP